MDLIKKSDRAQRERDGGKGFRSHPVEGKGPGEVSGSSSSLLSAFLRR